jgi:hypothetical protein
MFTLCHSFVSFFLVWSPVDGDLEGFQLASTWVAQRAFTIPLTGLIRFNQLLSRRTEHVHAPSLIGR